MAGTEVTEPEPTAAEQPLACEPDRLLHRVILVICLAMLAGSLVLEIRDGQQVLVPYVEVTVPATCTYKRLVGRDCPGCGLTRCFISLAHGRLTPAWHFNPAGILIFAVVVAQVPYRLLQVWRIRRGLPEFRLRRLTHALLWLMILGLFTQWVARAF